MIRSPYDNIELPVGKKTKNTFFSENIYASLNKDNKLIDLFNLQGQLRIIIFYSLIPYLFVKGLL